jgi:IS605 OrfB family transposase
MVLKQKKRKKHTVKDIEKSSKENHEGVFLPSSKPGYITHETDSWFSISKTNNIFWPSIKNITEKETLYARTFLIKPSKKQKRIINHMIKETIKIYNKGLKHIKSNKLYRNKNISFYDLRKSLSVEKNKIKKRTPTHVLDASIKKAVSNYKSAVTNFKEGNVKNFRIRYYKTNKNINKNLYFEPSYVRKNGSITGLGDLTLFDLNQKEEYKIEKKNIKKEFIISYRNGKYYFTGVFTKKTEPEKVKRQEFISLDPGINPFLTGVADNNSFVIGKDACNKIRKLNNRKDHIDSLIINKKKKKLLLDRLRQKIKNKIDDMHWKTINFLTASFDNILIGDLSSKDCIRRGGGLGKMNKRLLNSFRFYRFKERLKTRCSERNISFKEVNEYCTSKTCSCCGYFKKDLGPSKVYCCDQCDNVMDRDINGARNIYFVSQI